MLALALAALLTVGLAACGGGDSEDSTGAPTGADTEETTTAPPTTRTTTSGDKGSRDGGSGGSAEFRTPGGDNSIQNFGEEADASAVAAATAVLGGFLKARAGEDFAGQCASLAKSAVQPLEELAARSPQFKGDAGCEAVLAVLLEDAAGSLRANAMKGGIASLRVEGDRAFALYHGPKGVDYFVPMTKEDGKWKVGALEPTEFP